MHDSAPNIAECFRCCLFVYEWWGILQMSPYQKQRVLHRYIEHDFVFVFITYSKFDFDLMDFLLVNT